MSARTKEQVYDDEIAPLMAQIIAVCNDHKIAVVAQFHVPNADDAGLVCSTVLLQDAYLAGAPKAVRDNMLTAKSILIDGFVAWSRRY